MQSDNSAAGETPQGQRQGEAKRRETSWEEANRARGDFAALLRERRTGTGLSARRFARDLGIRPGQITAYEQPNPAKGAVPPVEYVQALVDRLPPGDAGSPRAVQDTWAAYERVLSLLAPLSAEYQALYMCYRLVDRWSTLTGELRTAREHERALASDLLALRAEQAAAGGTIDADAEQRLTADWEEAARRRVETAAEQERVAAELDAARDRLADEHRPAGALADRAVGTPVLIAGGQPQSAPRAGAGGGRGRFLAVLAAVTVFVIALGGLLIIRSTGDSGDATDKTAAGAGPSTSDAESSAPASPGKEESDDKKDNGKPSTSGDPSPPQDSPGPTAEPGPGRTATPPPTDPGYLVTWNAEFKVQGALHFDTAGEPVDYSGSRTSLVIQSNEGVEPYVSPNKELSLGRVAEGEEVPGPVACKELAVKQQIFRDELKVGNRYCAVASATVAYIEVVNVHRSGELSGLLIRWQPSQ